MQMFGGWVTDYDQGNSFRFIISEPAIYLSTRPTV